MFNDLLKQLVARKDLTATQAEEAIGAILSGDCTDAQIGAFMAAMATKGETFEELAGAADLVGAMGFAVRRRRCGFRVRGDASPSQGVRRQV